MGFLQLTAEDRAIFARLPIGMEFEYRHADSIAFAFTADDLHRHGSVVHAVACAEDCATHGDRRVLA